MEIVILNIEFERNLIEKACDPDNPNRDDDKRRLWEYIYGTYLDFLLFLIKTFEEKLPSDTTLPDSHQDLASDFIATVIERDKLCSWETASLKHALSVMLRNFLIDTLKRYTELKDKDGQTEIVIKKPLLSSAEPTHWETENSESKVEERHDLQKISKWDEVEDKRIDELEIKKIKAIKNKALLTLQRLSSRDALIIYLIEKKGLTRKQIAEHLNVKESGINKIIDRAYYKYSIILERLLKQEGYEIKCSVSDIKRILLDVTK